MSKEVTKEELLEAINGVAQQVAGNTTALRNNSELIKTVAEQVASNSEKLTELQNDIAKLPEEVAVRNNETFKDHEERITTLEVETGLAEV